jgi:glutamyl-Q tRNA(Asp) synthetase
MRARPINSGPILRFAPSPNGRLHLGHALSALTGFEHARALGGRFLLRIEDIDLVRTRDEFVAGIQEDLAWLGIEWDQPVLRQSEHFADYRRAAERLVALGVLYPCFATRTEIQLAYGAGPTDPDGAPLYAGLHKFLSPTEVAARRSRGEPFALRIDMERALSLVRARLGATPLTFVELDDEMAPRRVEAHPERWGDAVIVRKDVPASYHLAVVVDDARQQITHVTRGQDLFAATDLHRVVQILLDLPAPIYRHHRLLTGPDGQKLSKSAGDTALCDLRASGWTRADVRARIGLPPVQGG